MDTMSTNMHALLCGEGAFHKVSDYAAVARQEFDSEKPLPALYIRNFDHRTDNKIQRIAWLIFSCLCFPILCYKALHNLAGKFIILASTPKRVGETKDRVSFQRTKILDDKAWKYKRFTVLVDGNKIDAVLFGKPETFENGTWTLASLGNGEFYEYFITYNDWFKNLLTKTQSNAIVFNYPGVGASTGLPNRNALKKAYRAMLTFLESEIAAKRIIGYGHSIGGAVQNDAIFSHLLRSRKKYVFVKSRTFSCLAAGAFSLISQVNRKLAYLIPPLIKLTGWNINSAEISKKLKEPEIILQTCKQDDEPKCRELSYYELEEPTEKIRPKLARRSATGNFQESTPLLGSENDLATDGKISVEASLAKALLSNKKTPKTKKVFLGIPEDHDSELGEATVDLLSKKILSFFREMETT